MKKIMSLLLMLTVSMAIFAKGEIKTVVFTTNPQMHCENCENKIKGYLKFEKGIKNIETNVENQTVTITYDSEKTNPEKLQAAMKKINYDVKVVDSMQKGMKAIKKLDCGKACENAKKHALQGEKHVMKHAAVAEKQAAKKLSVEGKVMEKKIEKQIKK